MLIGVLKSSRWHPQMSFFVYNPKIFSSPSKRNKERRKYPPLRNWNLDVFLLKNYLNRCSSKKKVALWSLVCYILEIILNGLLTEMLTDGFHCIICAFLNNIFQFGWMPTRNFKLLFKIVHILIDGESRAVYHICTGSHPLRYSCGWSTKSF